ncbi:Ig-like domain-containing protein [Asanoa sp. NPDC050611]|uniref:L,D-transpeptidase n=1 Tax=Asanoa sp. NPDC050611 TaxID=3157098 RepID=UPI0033C2494F
MTRFVTCRAATRTILAATVAGALGLTLTACGGADQKPPAFVAAGDKVAATPSPTAPPVPFQFAVTPADKKKDLPVSTEIGTSVKGGQITSVKVVDKAGKAVSGAMREDKSSWVPSAPLKYDTSYTATVVATSAGGQQETKKVSFSTRGKSGNDVGSGLYLFNGKTYGVAMPVVVEFSPGIPQKDRAAVQRRLFVQTDPPQPGVWHWVSSGTQAYYRAPDYWRPGTKITVRAALEGIPLSNGRVGDEDRKATAKIGDKFEMKVENKTKKMQVFKNDKLVKTFPVSLGKASTPSSSGTLIVMDKQEHTVFDTFAELGPEEGYRTDIDFAQRLTWGGEYIHSAPWSVGDQGVRNVSHGCVNLAPANASWLFGQTKVGDPITIRGTERKLEPGNGWTAWNLSWAEFVKGSALPVPAGLKPATTSKAATPTPTATD